jgi:hypothetical protein
MCSDDTANVLRTDEKLIYCKIGGFGSNKERECNSANYRLGGESSLSLINYAIVTNTGCVVHIFLILLLYPTENRSLCEISL